MPPRFEVTFRVRQYGERWSIAVGVITEYRKDKQSSGDQDEREAAGLVSNSRDERGSVWVDGVCQFEDEDRMFVPPQRQVRMEVDLLELTIRFTSLAFECSRVTPLPEVFRKKKVYLFIAMNCKGDCVEILPK